MPRAFVKTKVGERVIIADSVEMIRIEDNYYFHPESTPSLIQIVKQDISNYFAFWRVVQVEG